MTDHKHADDKHADETHADHKDRATPGAPAPAPDAPPVQEYPKMLYHADGRQLTVASKEAEAAAKQDGFTEQPGAEAPARPKKEPR